MDCELAIIGAGPAGCSAAIYAGRAGIKVKVFDKGLGGGLIALSPNIENYLGFESISGIELAELIKKHASKYAEFHLNEEVKTVKKEKDNFHVETVKSNYITKAILLCTGTEHRKLNVPGEKELTGKGVSYCATCDGFFFKNKRVAVIGGGNTALIEAIYLRQIGCKDVTVIHRRDMLRAEKIYEEEALENGVKIIFNTIVESINGKEKVESISLLNTKTEERTKLDIDGVFISIGEEPQNKIAKDLNLKLDENGFVIVDRQGRTNIKGVYAAGDITGGLRQVITAAAEGAIAALTATEVLGKKYPY